MTILPPSASLLPETARRPSMDSDTPSMFDHLKSARSSQRLNQIEKIRANGIGRLIDLPQLAVCGDQSTGKSSVLEGITGIPFPREEGLCTRFPTQIIMRHSESLSEIQIKATIRPHAGWNDDTRKSLEAYQKEIQDMSDLPTIIQEVSTLLRLRGCTDSETAPAFASDVLQIEITGRIGLHLSVVDLPGLVTVPNAQQSQADIDVVHAMVAEYLASSRTIILAVVQASSELANQDIIQLARKHDPDGQRTVGIITKPDLTNEGTESKIALIARNEGSIKLKHGFFLVKNPSPSEREIITSMEMRSKLEVKYFSSPPWSDQNIDPNRVGAEQLRTFLQELMDGHIERELPKVRQDIKDSLAAAESKLKSLGAARQSAEQIRVFMTNLSMSLYQVLQAALDGNYYYRADPDFFDNDDASRLRASVQKLNSSFAENMRTHGQRRRIGSSKGSPNSTTIEMEAETAELIVSKQEMTKWVKQVRAYTRGRELPGNSNWTLLSELFHEQSRRWHSLAQRHIQRVLEVTLQWTDRAITKLVHEDKLRIDIRNILRDWLDEAVHLAMAELEKLIDDEKSSPLTYDHNYTKNIQMSRLKVQRSGLQAAVQKTVDNADRLLKTCKDVESFTSALQPHMHVNVDEQACEDALTELDAYYKVTMKTFVDNVARQVIERHIFTPLPKAFWPESVSKMSDEELRRLASEPEKQIAYRGSLTAQVKSLREGLSELQRSL